MDAQEIRIYTAILITSSVLGIIIIFFIISVLRQQRRIVLLHKKNLSNEITGVEKERARIATDLHDELAPVISAVKMRINSFELIDKDDLAEINQTNKNIDIVLKRLREISFDLMPHLLLKKGLITAIKQLSAYLTTEKIAVNFTYNEEIFFAENKAINIYRIIQESAFNAIKHSLASKINIDLLVSKNKIVLTISDDGDGFDVEAESKEKEINNTGFGLASLRNRCEMLNGKMFLYSKKGDGTVYTFEIDYNNEQPLRNDKNYFSRRS